MSPPSSSASNFSVIKWLFATSKIVFLLAFCYANENVEDAESCAMEASIDLTNASANASGFFDDSGHFFPLKATKIKAGIRYGCICDIKPCLAYCPESNMSRDGSPSVADDSADYSAIPVVYRTNLTLENDEEVTGSQEWFHVVKWDPCQKDSYHLLDPEKYPDDEYYLLRNGSLFIPKRKEIEAWFKDFRTSCLRLEGNGSIYTPKICAPRGVSTRDSFNAMSFIGGLVSVPFLIATVIVYSVLPELNNIHGTTLRCYLCCLIFTYVALGVSRTMPSYYSIAVRSFAFMSWFSFVSSFFWLNVMSFDLWWKLSGFGSLQRSCANDDRQKFIYYSIYAWGIGLVLTAIFVGTELSSSNTPPKIGSIAADIFYYTVPVGLTIACNICLFISTTVKIIQHNKRVRDQLANEDSRCHDDHKYWSSLHPKLFVVMGITWVTEIISEFWKSPKYLWLVMDMINVLQGILIFVIFVCKENIWISLRKHFHTGRFHSYNHHLLSCTNKSSKSPSASKATTYFDVQKSPSSDSNASSTISQTETLDLTSERNISTEKTGMD